MKIVTLSNFINHHQTPIADSFINSLHINYIFVAFERINNERLQLGYKDQNDELNYVFKAYENSESELLKIVDSADIVLADSCKDSSFEKRLKGGSIVYHTSERYFKRNKGILIKIRNYLSALKHIKKFQKYKMFYLCMSAYTSQDVNLYADYKNKTFKWGYFTKFIDYDFKELLKKKSENKIIEILWVGRLIKYKHPEEFVKLCEYLKTKGYQFVINVIGNGALKEVLQEEVVAKKLSNYIFFLGSMSPDDVRKYMERANIFIFTSDFEEGWGAVLNEAMNSGCAVVASHAIGAVPFLIKDEYNGLIYKNDVDTDFFSKVECLITNEKLRAEYGEKAFLTIKNEWNPLVAARRLLILDDCIKNGKETPFKEGPCSKADILKNNWF